MYMYTAICLYAQSNFKISPVFKLTTLKVSVLRSEDHPEEWHHTDASPHNVTSHKCQNFQSSKFKHWIYLKITLHIYNQKLSNDIVWYGNIPSLSVRRLDLSTTRETSSKRIKALTLSAPHKSGGRSIKKQFSCRPLSAGTRVIDAQFHRRRQTNGHFIMSLGSRRANCYSAPCFLVHSGVSFHASKMLLSQRAFVSVLCYILLRNVVDNFS